MQLAGLALGIIRSAGSQNQSGVFQKAYQGLASNNQTQELVFNRIHQEMLLMQQQMQRQMEEEQQLMNTSGLPAFPKEAADTAAQKANTFYNVHSTIWSNEFGNLMQEKGELFSSQHYEFDKNGNPLLDSQGNPKLFNGGETQTQAAARQNWESKQTSLFQQNTAEQKQAYVKSFAESYQQEIQNNIGQLTEPQVQAQLQASVARAETGLNEFEENLQMNILKVGLPTSELKEKADELFKRFKDDENSFTSQLSQSPEGQELQEYQGKMQQFLLEKKKELASNSDTPVGASPGLLSTLVPNSFNPELEGPIQDAAEKASQQFKAAFKNLNI